MITLYGFGPGFGLPEISPYVTKIEVLLHMAGLEYVKERGRPDRSPKGQLPYIEDDGDLIADSTFIRAHIEEKYGVDLDRGLDAAQRAQAWAIERMVENHLGWCMTHARWLLRPNFDKGPARFFDGAPDGVREGVYQQVNANVRAVGIGRHSDEEIADLGEKSLACLSQMLGSHRFMLRDGMTSVDAIVFGQLAGILTPYFDSPLRRRAEQFDNLVDYVDRMMTRCYPAFAAEARLRQVA
jgi:glutathione S-transferase